MSRSIEALGSTYALSPSGVLTNSTTGRILRGGIDASTGYQMFTLTPGNGRRYPVYLHRMLAELYLPNTNNLPEVNHKDGVKTNNSLDNLEWVTGLQNVRHAFSTGLTANRACVDYADVPALLREVLSGVTLHELTQREGVKESSTLRKLLHREAVRTGVLAQFLDGTKKARKSLVTAQSHAVIAESNSSLVHSFPSINEAARHYSVSPATVWKAIQYQRPFKGLSWRRA